MPHVVPSSSASPASSPRIAFIGLGALGAGLCHSLVRAGHHVTVTDLDPANATALLADGAHWAEDVARACREADVVFTALPSPSVSREAFSSGALHCLHSVRTRRCARTPSIVALIR